MYSTIEPYKCKLRAKFFIPQSTTFTIATQPLWKS